MNKLYLTKRERLVKNIMQPTPSAFDGGSKPVTLAFRESLRYAKLAAVLSARRLYGTPQLRKLS